MQLKVDAKQDLDKGAPKIRDHVDVRVCKFKTLKWLFRKLVYNKDNPKQQTSMSNPRVIASNIGL
jgi:hypothetical protein